MFCYIIVSVTPTHVTVAEKFAADHGPGLHPYPGNEFLYIHCANSMAFVCHCAPGTKFDPEKKILVHA